MMMMMMCVPLDTCEKGQMSLVPIELFLYTLLPTGAMQCAPHLTERDVNEVLIQMFSYLVQGLMVQC